MRVAEELPSITDQHAFNRERWADLCSDPFIASLDFRIETNAFGQITKSPPHGFDHSSSQGQFEALLRGLLKKPGQACPECPISTSDGVKAADVVWISETRLEKSLQENLLTIAPEICIEVLSPSNTLQEIERKRELYFESGAEEVWVCGLDGNIEFYLSASPDEIRSSSTLCPDFPPRIDRG